MSIRPAAGRERSNQLLSQDDSKFVAAMMPCRIAVYEKTDGRTYVTSMNMSLMSDMFPGDIGSVLKHIAIEDWQILDFVERTAPTADRAGSAALNRPDSCMSHAVISLAVGFRP